MSKPVFRNLRLEDSNRPAQLQSDLDITIICVILHN